MQCSRGDPSGEADPRAEEGQTIPLIVGLVVVSIALILVASAAASAQMARIRMFDVADAAALDAADASSEIYDGVSDGIPLTDSSVRQEAQQYLDSVPRPASVTSWNLAPGTGAEGNVAVVVLRGTVKVPVVGPLVGAVGGSVQVSVTSRARATIVD